MREKTIESHLRKEIKKLGGKAFKFVSPGTTGVPDRIVLLPTGRIYFVELKAEGKKSTPLQDNRQKEIRLLGFDVRVIDSKEGVNAFIEEVST